MTGWVPFAHIIPTDQHAVGPSPRYFEQVYGYRRLVRYQHEDWPLAPGWRCSLPLYFGRAGGSPDVGV